MTFPWDAPPVPAVIEPAEPPAAMSTEDTVAALQRDFAYAMSYTAVMVHSKHDALQFLVNTPRGQIVPQGECKLSDGTTIEFHDIGMPQVGVPVMTVKELIGEVWSAVAKLGLGVQP